MKSGKKPDNAIERRVRKYRLAQRAKEDLIAIARFGDERFGVAQSDQYRERLKQRFSVLAEHPQLYPTLDHIRQGYHRSVCGAHSIYYRVGADGVEIVRILKHQDLNKVF